MGNSLIRFGVCMITILPSRYLLTLICDEWLNGWFCCVIWFVVYEAIGYIQKA